MGARRWCLKLSLPGGGAGIGVSRHDFREEVIFLEGYMRAKTLLIYDGRMGIQAERTDGVKTLQEVEERPKGVHTLPGT